jgi:YggT family protein
MSLIIIIIDRTIDVFTILIFVYTLLGYFLSPYHPIRETIGRILEPMLAPIRKRLPPMGGLDFSPLVLILLLQIIGWVLISILRGLI